MTGNEHDIVGPQDDDTDGDDMSDGVVGVAASSSVPDEYRVVVVSTKMPSQLEGTLNRLAREGYSFLAVAGNYILMRRVDR